MCGEQVYGIKITINNSVFERICMHSDLVKRSDIRDWHSGRA